ncbi:WXG100 family type VII secretion target [Streptomyces sp. RS10V-4]|uniref:WXG100 family type VII secretion target n=1 Tax=Streptomyces rhizoryzae TaxID=2932493 RepID=UPI002002C24C|nr:WXG100 family type VII secretion target [Streptomyces rhizoryzae]MCK7625638.1 WXG100 family type VII secretion target [Streptomyces rhizoryzae]
MTEPRRNPHALHEAAAGWREMGKHLDGMVRDLDRHVGTAAAADWHGPAGEAFAAEWHQLKRTVDESLPAFELAAADLDGAAGAAHPGTGGGDHESSSGHAAPPAQQTSSGPEMAYGFMALGQLANALGGSFGRRGRGGGGGQSQVPQLRHQWESSTAAHGPDPFGPPRDGEAATPGGAGIAKGVRTNPAEAQRAADEREAKAAAGQKAAERKGASGTADGPEPAAEPAGAKAGERSAAEEAGKGAGKDAAKGAGQGPGRNAARPGTDEQSGTAPAGPDVTQHGAFG